MADPWGQQGPAHGGKGLDGIAGGRVPLPSFKMLKGPRLPVFPRRPAPSELARSCSADGLPIAGSPGPEQEDPDTGRPPGIGTKGTRSLSATQSNRVVTNNRLWLASCSSIMQNA